MLVVLTPLSKEKDLLNEALAETGWRGQIEKNGFLTGILFKEQAVCLFVGGHGKTQFALHTQHLIHHIPRLTGILCVGAAGSLTKSVNPGDLVIGEKTIEHDFNLKFVKRPLPNFDANPIFLKKAATLKSKTVHLGVVASGDEDIIDSLRANEIAQKTGAMAVAWEGAGGARACQFNQIPYLEVRAITDFADKAAATDFNLHLKAGMTAAAHFLNQFVQRSLLEVD